MEQSWLIHDLQAGQQNHQKWDTSSGTSNLILCLLILLPVDTRTILEAPINQKRSKWTLVAGNFNILFRTLELCLSQNFHHYAWPHSPPV